MAKAIKKEKIGTEVKAAPIAAPTPAAGPVSGPASGPVSNPARTTTPVRNSAIPKQSAGPVKKIVTHEMVARRAYEISISGNGGSDFENWIRAEKELRGEL